MRATDSTTRLTADRLRQVLDYDKASGSFRWLTRRHFGKVAGFVKRDGARRIKINGREFMAARLAWLYVYGRWPGSEINHVNGVAGDNRIMNLREATHSQIQIAWKQRTSELSCAA